MNNSDLKFIRPDWPAPSNVKALVTTRQGGLSASHFDSLNLGLHVGDDHATVVENRQLLKRTAKLPSEPIWLVQTHSTNIVELSGSESRKSTDYDGATTRVKNVVCAVMTADCLPLFLCCDSGKQVGVLHVGWRGLANGIIQRGIKLFDCDPRQVIAWAGPCISQDFFEIGVEVKQHLGGQESAYRNSMKSGKCYADMVALTGQVLAECGVKNYANSDYCSYRDEALFYSYRRDQITGRMASLIWLE